MNDKQNLIKRIAKNAIVLALYVALNFISYPIAYANLQFRLSEILILLCFFNRDYIIPVTLGCFLSNLASPFMPWDLLIGTTATFISSLLVSFSPYLGIAVLFPIAANSFLVGIEYVMYLKLPYLYSVGIIALGESVVVILSYILFLLIMKKEFMMNLISAKRKRDFKW